MHRTIGMAEKLQQQQPSSTEYHEDGTQGMPETDKHSHQVDDKAHPVVDILAHGYQEGYPLKEEPQNGGLQKEGDYGTYSVGVDTYMQDTTAAWYPTNLLSSMASLKCLLL